MQCQEARDIMAQHLTLPQDDLLYRRLQRHATSCEHCRLEFETWQASAEWFSATEEPEPAVMQPVKVHRMTASPNWLSDQVMARIYREEPWRMPLVERTHDLSYARKLQVTAVAALCFTLFFFSLFYSLIWIPSQGPFMAEAGVFEMLPMAGSALEDIEITDEDRLTATAAIRDIQTQLHLPVGPLNTDPNLWLVLSLLGGIFSLLLVSWLAQVKTREAVTSADAADHLGQVVPLWQRET